LQKIPKKPRRLEARAALSVPGSGQARALKVFGLLSSEKTTP
jgi:hypothetical protein